ncbi:hypothetical protein DFA_09919 [Cavenderia fasciculata]|uniref:RanBD1 domain-containing protein n=1 Tax=Cavenderia fasciculata TaxID=261658 RepID=F4Q8S6_CACFS|nr:uncharacterized protein DFA_09919 [Cavenderia fasciculata]EGG15095.1 hypothetical protein DFA_09919 [Cavenderia fasciculata]|eukprot:XP_004351815.1 hypothetical protein DFA_09919 [Cavenderia fasciculata]
MAETTEALVGKKRQHDEEEETSTETVTAETVEQPEKEQQEEKEEKQIKKKKVEEEEEPKEEKKAEEPKEEKKVDDVEKKVDGDEKKGDEEKKADEAPKLSIFSNTSNPWSFSSFASTSTTDGSTKPFSSTFGSFATTSTYSFNLSNTSSFLKPSNGESNSENKSENTSAENTTGSAGGEEGATGDFWTSSTYVPILQNLQQVETKTGEEGETTIYSAKAKLYVMEDTYKERGVGTLKLNKDSQGNSRLIFIIDGSKRSGLNVSIFVKMTIETPTEKSLRFTAFEDNKFTTFLANLKKPEEVEQFEKNIKKRIDYLKEQNGKETTTTTKTAEEEKK